MLPAGNSAMAKKKQKEEPGLVEQLRAAIRDSGLSLNQLAQQAGVATPMLSRFVKGERGLSLAAAEKVCKALRLGLTRLKGAVAENN
jgi:transcriptional regulator with XRE-family HTH domain